MAKQIMDLELTSHAKDMMKERGIPIEWIERAIQAPDRENTGADGLAHYFKVISEHGERILHVVVNPHASPRKVITIFFDRRARRVK